MKRIVIARPKDPLSDDMERMKPAIIARWKPRGEWPVSAGERKQSNPIPKPDNVSLWTPWRVDNGAS